MDIAENFKTIGADIPDHVTMIAVSKKQPDARIDAALAHGWRVYGENRVQEAQGRWTHRRDAYPDLTLHLIGPLQSNKTKDAVALFDVIHTVDRPKIAKTLAKEMKAQDRHLPCFIQVNTGDEDQKSGIHINNLPEFYTFCTDECGLNVIGLMCIPPVHEPAEHHFKLLKHHNDMLSLPSVSMGMSGDYMQAIENGATHVRIGSALFGARDEIVGV